MLQSHLSSNPRLLKGNTPLLLTQEQDIWWVQSGTLVVFSTELDEKAQLRSDRQYLFTVEAGELLWGMTSERKSVVAIALEESNVQAIAADLSTKLPIEPHLADGIEGWIRHWDEWLSHQSLLNRSEGEILTATSARYYTLLKQQVLQGNRQTVQWVKIQHGQVRWLGLEAFTLDANSPIFPLTPHTYLIADHLTEIQIVSLTDLSFSEMLSQSARDGANELLSGLQQFHRFLQHLLQHLEEQHHAEELRRFQERERLNQQIFYHAMNDLLSPLQATPVEISQDGSPLLVAAGAVAHAMGITLRPPAESEDIHLLKDPLEAIAHASKFRTRIVQLVGEWWNEEHGPLLAYTLEGQPIALLQSGKYYIAFDPIDLSRTPVNAAYAKTLSKSASMLYRPLPEVVGRIPSILTFALRGYLKEILLIILMGILGSLLGMVVPQVTQILINQAIPEGDRAAVWQLGLALFAAACGQTAFGLTQGLLSLRVENAADSTLQPAVWDRLLQLPTTFFRKYSMGDLLTRMMAVNQIRQHLSSATQRTLLNAIFSLLNLGLMLIYSVPLSAVAVGITLVSVILTGVSSTLLLGLNRRQEELSGKLNGLNVELINGVAKLRVAAAENRAFGAWARVFSQRSRVHARIQHIDNGVAVVGEALPILSSVMIYWFIMMLTEAAQQEGGKPFSIGALLAFSSAFGTFQGGVISLSNTGTNLLNIIPLWERAKPILHTSLESSLEQADPGRLQGEIQMDRVVFRYREDGPLILDDVSLMANPGEFVALVGPSGSGKSTLLRLLLGFEMPLSGTVYYDGQDLTGLDVQSVRRQCGVVLQNGRIGAGSLFENITGGALISLSQAWEATRMAGFAEDIEQMPMGMHTVVSEGGMNLSGGQRQRLLIARAIVLRPKIILFDEATSALDNRTQAIVSESLDRLNVTRIVIAHRLSTIRNADRIYVMEAGRIVQTGTFEELIHQEGLFARLAARQLD
ncbi:NHLP bacteriocin export ABC transporter permease/ATPase subunit [Nostoc sp. C052]|uniref:NHLP bacteriocin export ABC transporter permease/ATPase subunit n=1 Tax=Nostoc sp. C052 TaxID=2576902 RepID=UPI0015C405A2|nr:NHLP bacteriocin export ABC transporter permease/ATPase subunit [Nostoc sp. C052]QLE40171.1 NHLP bacteriocin export ABC transporter permease/ATPase subunit [Nostoc sp. C052]